MCGCYYFFFFGLYICYEIWSCISRSKIKYINLRTIASVLNISVETVSKIIKSHLKLVKTKRHDVYTLKLQHISALKTAFRFLCEKLMARAKWKNIEWFDRWSNEGMLRYRKNSKMHKNTRLQMLYESFTNHELFNLHLRKFISFVANSYDVTGDKPHHTDIEWQNNSWLQT